MAGRATAVRAVARSAARNAAVSGLSTASRLGRRQRVMLARPRVQFVYLHTVPRRQEQNFRDFLSLMRRDHEFITYSEAVSKVRGGDIDRPFACFSFDDGFESCKEAASILEEYNTRGCFFVPASFVGCSSVYEARAFFRTAVDVDEVALTWDDLEKMLERGHEVGNHTRHHLNIAEQSSEELVEEIIRSHDDIEQHLGVSEQHFAWPFGRYHHFSGAASSLVAESRHLSCASAERGSHVAAPGGTEWPSCVHRDHIDASWPVQQSMYFIARSSARAQPPVASWPDPEGPDD